MQPDAPAYPLDAHRPERSHPAGSLTSSAAEFSIFLVHSLDEASILLLSHTTFRISKRRQLDFFAGFFGIGLPRQKISYGLLNHLGKGGLLPCSILLRPARQLRIETNGGSHLLQFGSLTYV